MVGIARVDSVFSLCVRERASWQCECCGAQYPRGVGGLEASHFYGRRYRGLRFFPDNAFAHCILCHAAMGRDRPRFEAWTLQQLGPERFDALTARRNRIWRATEDAIDAVHANLKLIYAKMERERNMGLTGRLRMASPYEEDIA